MNAGGWGEALWRCGEKSAGWECALRSSGESGGISATWQMRGNRGPEEMEMAVGSCRKFMCPKVALPVRGRH